MVAKYEYDDWGNVLTVSNASNQAITDPNHIANLNPFRYRSYYYDSESGLYYLMSRYYDPVTHRFLNADGYFQSGDNILDTNMNAYCRNNPVMYYDPSGKSVFLIVSICILIVGVVALAGCSSSSSSSTPYHSPSSSSTPTPAPTTTPSSSTSTQTNTLSEDQKVLVATIAAEATVTAQGNPVSSAGRQAMVNVALNRVGVCEWSQYKTVAEICQYTGFDGYGNENFQDCMTYLNARDGSNATYEAIIWDVMSAYNNDITQGCQLYYTPAAMVPAGSSPDWNFDVLTEVTIPGVDVYYEGRFYRYN